MCHICIHTYMHAYTNVCVCKYNQILVKSLKFKSSSRDTTAAKDQCEVKFDEQSGNNVRG